MSEEEKNNDSVAEWSDFFYVWLYRGKFLLKRYWWVFLVSVSFCVGFQSYRQFTKAPYYTSYAQMIVSGRIALPDGAIYSEELSNFFGTQISLMRSQRVQERARARVEALHPELVPISVGLSVVQSPDASIFLLQASGRESEYTQAYLGAIMHEYLNFKNEMRAQTVDRTFLAITEEVIELQEKIEKGEDEKVEFQKENNIVFIQEQGSNIGAYLSELNRDLTEYTTRLHFLDTLTLDAVLEKEESNEGDSDERLLQVSKAFLEVKRKLDLLQAELDEYSVYMKPKHPHILTLKQEIQTESNQLRILKRQAAQEIEGKKRSLKSQVENLELVIDAQEVHALDFSRRLAEFDRINSRLDRQKQVLERLLSSIQSLDINLSLDQDMVSILENASAGALLKPNIFKEIITAIILGIILGVGILVLISLLDARIITPEDIQERFDEPVFGVIPYEKGVFDQDSVHLLSFEDKSVIFAQACRNLRSSILSSQGKDNEPVRALAVTSCVPSEGKSTLSSNLAITFAFTSAKTILIDADLRRGSLHKAFGVSNEKGVSSIVADKAPLDEVIQHTGVENLDFIARGPTHEHPGELLISRNFETVLKELKKRYEYIIFDTAPVLATDDTVGFASQLDGTLFVMRSGSTQTRQVKAALGEMALRRARILGFVLNCVEKSGAGYYYYKYTDYYATEDSGDNAKKS